MYDTGRQVGGEKINKVGAVHAVARVPGGVRHLHRRDRRSIVAKIVRVRPHPRTPFFDSVPEPHTLQMAHRIRRHINAGANLPQRRRLFINGNAQPLRDQRIGGEQAADAAPDNHYVQLRSHIYLRSGHFGTASQRRSHATTCGCAARSNPPSGDFAA